MVKPNMAMAPASDVSPDCAMLLRASLLTRREANTQGFQPFERLTTGESAASTPLRVTPLRFMPLRLQTPRLLMDDPG
jgi:hypothetical protein